MATALQEENNRSIADSQLNELVHEICAGFPPAYERNLLWLPNKQNILCIVRYVNAMKTEINSSDSYRRETIDVLRRFCIFTKNLPFQNITRDNIVAFMDSLRKPETVDPLHKWIGSYNLYRMYLIRFFKWLHAPPGMDHEKRKHSTIPVLENIPKLRRREVSIYKPSDIWSQSDDLLFLKYCPSKRDRCYHAMSRDLSCRPSELLKLKIRDVVFKTIGKSQYAEVVVNGKTTQRPIPLINSLPYLKDYLDHGHPMPGNPNAPLICGVQKSLGKHITTIAMSHAYENYKMRVFPGLLELPSVTPEDKKLIKELLKKPWNLYIRRHSALTEKSRMLKESVLRQHAGWSAGSQMHLKYVHYFGNESNESLLEAYGLIDHGVFIDQLRPSTLTAVKEQLEDFSSQAIDSTLRGMYYALVATAILPNIQEIYRALSHHTARWREAGILPIDCFEDDTRNISKDFDDDYESIGDYISHGIRYLRQACVTYKIPRWHNQRNYVEVWVEKNAARRNIKSMVSDLHVVVVTNGGNSSVPYFNSNVERLKEKQLEGKLIYIIYVGDMDPSGEMMPEVYKRKFEEYGLYNVNFILLAVTMEQVRQFNLLSDPDPKTLDKLQNDANRFKFMEKYDLTKISDDPNDEYVTKITKSTKKPHSVKYSYVIREIRNSDGTTSYVKHDPTKLFAVELEAMQTPDVREYLKTELRETIEGLFDEDIYEQVQSEKPTESEINGQVLTEIKKLAKELRTMNK